MVRFKDYLKAEIFAETFSKIFFSGPAGRAVAIVFAISYFCLSAAVTILSAVFGILWWTLRKILESYLGSGFRIRQKTYAELRKTARKFGDRIERSDSEGWQTATLAGNGLRTGPFILELFHHPQTGSLRAFRTIGNARVEFDFEEMLRYSGKDFGFPKISDVPEFYRNVRTYLL